jgi:hypothetical protein
METVICPGKTGPVDMLIWALTWEALDGTTEIQS